MKERGAWQMRSHRKKKNQQNPVLKEMSSEHEIQEENSQTNPRLKALILEVVDNQIRANDPPETKQAYQRLLAAGYSRPHALEMIGSALTEEIWQMLHDHQPFDRSRFQALLDHLR